MRIIILCYCPEMFLKVSAKHPSELLTIRTHVEHFRYVANMLHEECREPYNSEAKLLYLLIEQRSLKYVKADG